MHKCQRKYPDFLGDVAEVKFVKSPLLEKQTIVIGSIV